MHYAGHYYNLQLLGSLIHVRDRIFPYMQQINTHKDRNAELEEERNRLLHDVQEYRNQLLVQRERFSSNSAADEHMEAVVKVGSGVPVFCVCVRHHSVHSHFDMRAIPT